MKWRMLALFMVVGVHFAYAQVTDSNFQVTDSNFFDHLLSEKTKAQGFVLSLKMAYEQDNPKYKTGKTMYAIAQTAYNNYTMAMLESYKVDATLNIRESAKIAASSAKEFEDYVSSFKEIKGFQAAFIAAGMLIEIGERLFTFIKKERADLRARTAEAMARQLTWEDWDKIGTW